MASPPLDFEDIYAAFVDHVYRWTRALGGPPAERDDVVQDVFLAVHRRLADFDGKDVAAWIYKITRRRVRDYRRLHWTRLFLGSSAPDDLVSFARGPDAEIESKEQIEVIFRLLAKLPEAQRVAFALFEIEGYSGEEIARLQEVPINTVWARVKTAREKLAIHVDRVRRSDRALSARDERVHPRSAPSLDLIDSHGVHIDRK